MSYYCAYCSLAPRSLTTCVIRCLAHIVNIVTQSVITTYSKSEHFNPIEPDTDFAGTGAERDEVGLVRAIGVKVCCHCHHPGVP
jgi:hypothetical protein